MAVKHTHVSAKVDGPDTSLVQPGDWNADHTIDNGTITRVMQAVDGKGWAFLGSAKLGSANVTCGPFSWAGSFQQIKVKYLIRGYSGAAIARLLIGAGSIPTTTATNGATLLEGTTTLTAYASKPGVPLAVTDSAIQRGGWAFIDGDTGQFKEIDVIGHNGNPSVSVGPTLYRATSFFSDLSTNLLIQRMQLSSYADLTTSAIGSDTLSTGTYLMAWGRNSD
jgi:hypothetical protein